MKYYRYKFRVYLNASHAIYTHGIIGQVHPHTWEIHVTVIKSKDDFLPFHEVEGVLEDILNPYQDKCLNEVEPFTITNPTLENICEKFKEDFSKSFYTRGWILLAIELGETPTRSYFIDLSEEADKLIAKKNEISYTDTIDKKARRIILDIIK